MPNKEKVLKGLEWILEDDRFGFGQGLTQPESEEEQAGVYIRQAIDYLNGFSRDAVPVVRCENCQYWQDNNGGYPHPECRWGHDETPYPDDYCSFASDKRQITEGGEVE